jgi:serine phosphatase RsbU (regulator of sigma subunit)
MDAVFAESIRQPRLLAQLLGAFAGLALLLAAIGTYGVLSYMVVERRREIGVRMALGAARGSVVALVMKQGLLLTIVGVAVGVAGALGLNRLMESLLFGVQPTDPATLAATTTTIALVAVAACALPAWRAAMVPPMVAMRDQPESMWHSARLKVRRSMRELAAGSDLAVTAPGTLTSDIAGAIHRAASFPDAVAVALATLRERVGAQSILLFEKGAGDEYRGPDSAIPAHGVLINRLRQYPHPLPLTAGDFQAWERWTREVRPAHAAEIEHLARSGARMAVPLRTAHELVGVLLLGPPEGREDFTAAETQLLGSAAGVFALLIENARLNERALEQEKVRRDLALAAEVQRRLLPAEPPKCTGATFAAFTLPARTVGGDYYDFLELADGRIGIAVADIAGKGIAAALLMSAVHASLRVMAAERDLPAAQLAAQMNRFLHRSTRTNSYATFFYAQLDLPSRRLRYVNAGHNPPYLVRRVESGVEITELSVGGTVLGLFPDVEYEEGDIELRPGDLLVAFTDGVTEARSPGGEELGEERLQEFLRGAVEASTEEIASTLADRIRAWIAGAEQHDDVTFVIAAVH